MIWMSFVLECVHFWGQLIVWAGNFLLASRQRQWIAYAFVLIHLFWKFIHSIKLFNLFIKFKTNAENLPAGMFSLRNENKCTYICLSLSLKVTFAVGYPRSECLDWFENSFGQNPLLWSLQHSTKKINENNNFGKVTCSTLLLRLNDIYRIMNKFVFTHQSYK